MSGYTWKDLIYWAYDGYGLDMTKNTKVHQNQRIVRVIHSIAIIKRIVDWFFGNMEGGK